MTVRRVAWSVTARADLKAIFDFFDPIDSSVARRIVNQVIKTAEGLAHLPTLRRSRIDGILERTVPNTRYILAFNRTVDADGNELYQIVRVIHSARDWRPGKLPPK